MRNPNRFLVPILSVGFMLAACEKAPNVTEAGGNSPDAKVSPEKELQTQYAQSVLELKRTIKDPALLSQKVLELQSGYTFKNPEPTPEQIAAARAHTEAALKSQSGEEGAGIQSGTPSLSKTASSATLVKNYDTYVRQTYVGSAVLYRGNTLTVTANAIGSADPFVVIYERHGQSMTYGNIDVFAYDDDGAGGLSSRVSYTNNSQWSTPRTMEFIVFSANAEGGIGNVNLVVNNGGAVSYINNVPARGIGAVYNNAGTAPCATPGNSQIVTSPSYAHYFTMDASSNYTDRGSIDKPDGYSWWIPPMDLTGTPNFVVSFVSPGSSEPLGNLKQYDVCP